MITLQPGKENEQLRIDRYLRKLLVNAALSQVYKLLRTAVTVNGKRVKQDYRLHENDVLHLALSEKEFSELTQNELKRPVKQSFEVLYEDQWLLIVDKPAGLASQPGTGVMGDNLTDQVNSYLKKIAHPINRLDRYTPGIVLFTKDRATANLMYAMSKNNEIEKKYLAIVEGKMVGAGKMEDYLERVTEKFQHKSVLTKDHKKGKHAITFYRVIKNIDTTTLVEFTLQTGRMHQIRAQTAARGHPVVGDPIYGKTEGSTTHQVLCAHHVAFIHPVTKKMLELKIKKLPKGFPKTTS